METYAFPTHVLRNTVFQKKLKIYVKNTVKLIENYNYEKFVVDRKCF